MPAPRPKATKKTAPKKKASAKTKTDIPAKVKPTKPSNPLLDGILSKVDTESKSTPEKEPVPEVKPEPVQEKQQIVVQEKKPVPEQEPVVAPEPLSVVSPIDKDTLFKNMMSNVDDAKMKLTDEEKAIIDKETTKIQRSYTGIIKKCNSDNCQIRDMCPFSKVEKYPYGQLCPVELSVADFVSGQYYKLLEEEIGSTDFNMIEIGTINNLVECDIEELRTRAIINTKGTLVQAAAFAIKDTGEVIYNDVENPLYNLRDRISRRKQRLLQRLLITPEAKAKFHLDARKKGLKNTKAVIDTAEEKIQQFIIDQDDNNKADGNGRKQE